MKKLLLGIIVLAFVLVATSAMAAGPKAPKALCLDYVVYGDYHILYFKSLGNVPTSGGNVKMYTASGYSSGSLVGPVHGNGYVALGTTILHAAYNGKGPSISSLHDLGSWELFFDLATNSGTIWTRIDYSDGTRFLGTGSAVVATDCASLGIPSAMGTSGVEKLEAEQ